MNSGPERRPRRWPLWKILVTVHLPALAVLVTLAVIGPRIGVPLATLIRDPAQVARMPEYIGALSNIGALCWCAAAVVCLFSSSVVRRARRTTGGFLFWYGMLTAALLLDDLFLIHDGVLARELHIGDKKIYAAYFLAAAAHFVAFRRLLLAREPHSRDAVRDCVRGVR